MAQVGFIRNKQEIKYLILYIAERLIAPVPIEVMQELTMCDPAVEFFDFSECLSYLVDTQHMTCSKDGLYAITEKGVQNGRACVDEIPYSVRLTAERLTEEQNKKIQRQRQVQSSFEKNRKGTFDVKLSFNDDTGHPLWKMELAVPDRDTAKQLTSRFQANPERMYNDLIQLLFAQKEE